jgi:hypothetical protein
VTLITDVTQPARAGLHQTQLAALFGRRGRMASVSNKKQGTWDRALKSFGLGFAVFILGCLSETWLTLHSVHGLLAFTDNILTGMAAGALVLLYERWQQREAQKKLETIRLMNHHVRNALQVIYAASDDLDGKKRTMVQDAMHRIEWTLREVLPGETDLKDSLTPPNPRAPKKESAA